jgi:putative endonuclease
MASHAKEARVECPERSRRAFNSAAFEQEFDFPCYAVSVNVGLKYVYILRCGKSLYIGLTDNVKDRLAQHRTRHGARHTRILGNPELVYTEGPIGLETAVRRERQLKCWSRAKKEALIAGNLSCLHDLSKSRENQPL